MAILRSNGVLIVDSIPTHTPAGNEATLARLKDTTTHYYWDSTLGTPAWVAQDFGGNDVSIYSEDGNTGATLRTVTNGAGIRFDDPNYLGTDYVQVINDNDNSYTTLDGGFSGYQGIIFKETDDIGGEYFIGASEVGLLLDSSSTRVSGSLVIGTNNNITDLESILSNPSGSISVKPSGHSFEDSLVSKKGMQLLGFGEADVDDTTNVADYSTLVNTSLVPKRYVDELVATKPNSYDSAILALAGEGVGKPFIYSATNTDGAVANTQAWT